MSRVGLHVLLQRITLTFGRLILGIGLQVLLIVLLARVLGPTGNGSYNVAVLVPILLFTFLNLGAPASSVYFVARGEVSLRRCLALNGRVLGLAAPAGLAAGLLAVLAAGGAMFPGVSTGPLLLGVALFPIALSALLATGLTQAVQDFRAYNSALLAPSVVNLAILLVLWPLGALSVGSALAAWGAGQLAGLLVALVALPPGLRGVPPPPGPGLTTGRFLRFGAVAHAANVITFLNYRLDLYLVNLLGGAAAAGVFVVALQLGERFWLLSQATSTVLLPRLSELGDDEQERLRLTTLAVRWVTYAGVLLALVVVPLAGPVIRLLFGPAFAGAAQALVLLLPGILAMNAARLLANDLASRGRPDLNLATSVATFAVNLAGNLLLIPRYGLNGAAVAATLAYVTTLVGCLLFHTRLSGTPWWHTLVPRRYDLHLLGRLLGRKKP